MEGEGGTCVTRRCDTPTRPSSSVACERAVLSARMHVPSRASSSASSDRAALSACMHEPSRASSSASLRAVASSWLTCRGQVSGT